MTELTAISVIFEDEDILLINKPAGIVVNQAETTHGLTIQDWFLQRMGQNFTTVTKSTTWQNLLPPQISYEYGQPLELWQERKGLVHRLDKDTSGLLLLAKNPGALVHLLWQFKTRQTQKKYLVLCHGKFALQEGKIHGNIARASHDRLKFTVVAEGKEAETDYQVRQHFSASALVEHLTQQLRQARDQHQQIAGNPEQVKLAQKDRLQTRLLLKKLQHSYEAGFTLLDAWPKTGRTHQIRVHFAAQHHPLVGDQLYLGPNRAKLDRLWCPRQFLHAESLTFHHPRTGLSITFQAPLSTDLQEVLAKLSL